MKNKRLLFSILPVVLIALFITLTWGGNNSQAKSDNGNSWLGVYIQDVDSDMAQAKGLKSTDGILVDDVVDDSPAEKGGIESGDIIIKFKGKKTKNEKALRKAIESSKPGEEVEIIVLRDGKDKKLTIKIGEAEKRSYSYNWNFDDNELKMFGNSCMKSNAGLGILIDDLSEQLGDYFGVNNGEGVLINEVLEDSPAEKSGLKAGDVIIKVDDDKIKSIDDLREIISEKDDGDKIKVVVKRNKKEKDFKIELSEEFAFSSHFEISTPFSKTIELNIPHITAPDFEIEMKEFEKSMKELKKELKELKKELKK